MSKHKESISNVSGERKFFIGVIILTFVIFIGGIWLMSKSGKKVAEKLATPLMGEAIQVQGADHIKEGQSHPSYNSDPPTSGWMYDGVAGPGIHDSQVPDERLIHSMEHGAVVVHYKADLPSEQIDKVKSAFTSARGKKILVPRENLDAAVAITSWGRLLTLQEVDESAIKLFIETNSDRAPEKSNMY